MLTGLGLGGDDYLSKPFRIAELRARVAAHLRRESGRPAAASAAAGWTSIWRSGPSTAGRNRCT